MKCESAKTHHSALMKFKTKNIKRAKNGTYTKTPQCNNTGDAEKKESQSVFYEANAGSNTASTGTDTYTTRG